MCVCMCVYIYIYIYTYIYCRVASAASRRCLSFVSKTERLSFITTPDMITNIGMYNVTVNERGCASTAFRRPSASARATTGRKPAASASPSGPFNASYDNIIYYTIT